MEEETAVAAEASEQGNGGHNREEGEAKGAEVKEVEEVKQEVEEEVEEEVKEEVGEVKVEGNKNEKLGTLDAQWGDLVYLWATMNPPGRRSSSESAVVSVPMGVNCTTPSSSLRRRRSSPLQNGFKMWDNEYAFEEQQFQRGRRLVDSGFPLSTAMSAAMEETDYLSEEVCSGGGGGDDESAIAQTASEAAVFSGSENHVCAADGSTVSASLSHLFSSTSSSSSPLPAYRDNKGTVVEKEEVDLGGGRKKRRFSWWRQAMSFVIWFVAVLVLGMVIRPAAELYIFHETQDTVFLQPT